MKQKFNPDLASEMEWSECVLAASLKEKVTDDDLHSCWICAECTRELILVNHEHLTDTAQEFLDRGWRYRRTRTGIDALCSDCRK